MKELMPTPAFPYHPMLEEELRYRDEPFWVVEVMNIHGSWEATTQPMMWMEAIRISGRDKGLGVYARVVLRLPVRTRFERV